eukprot:4081344-Pyramimonas_sp.AAC.2
MASIEAQQAPQGAVYGAAAPNKGKSSHHDGVKAYTSTIIDCGVAIGFVARSAARTADTKVIEIAFRHYALVVGYTGQASELTVDCQGNSQPLVDTGTL